MKSQFKNLPTIHETKEEHYVYLPSLLCPRKPALPNFKNINQPSPIPSPRVHHYDKMISPRNSTKSTLRPGSNDNNTPKNIKTLSTQDVSPTAPNSEREHKKFNTTAFNQLWSIDSLTEIPQLTTNQSRITLPSLGNFSHMTYDDDEELHAQTEDETKKYDIKNQFDITLKLRKNIIKSNPANSDTYPLLCTITANKPTYFKKSPVDIVCVIDKSGSMDGEKLDYVKQALASIIDLLDENDRLSIVTFNESAARDTHLQCMTKDNKARTLRVIKNIEAEGTTNIGDGMEHALRILKDRRSVNHISGILLLSDGLDHLAIKAVEESLTKIEIDESFSIHTFGFGNDHDPDLMTKIADFKLGNFYFIEDLKLVDQAFLNCLGSLAYSFATDGAITFIPQHPSVLEESIKILRPMGDPAIWTQHKDTYTAKIGHLIANKTHNFILKVKVPQNERELKTDLEKVIDIVKAKFTFKDLKGNAYEVVKTLSVHLLNDYEPTPTFKDERDVVAQYFRCKTYETLVQARRLAEKYLNAKALDLLQKFRLELEVCIVRKNPLIQSLIQDVVNAQSDVAPRRFEYSGKHNLIAVSRAQGQEKYSFQSSFKYSSPGQEKYQDLARSNNLLI